MYSISIFFKFYILLISGGGRTHPPAYGPVVDLPYIAAAAGISAWPDRTAYRPEACDGRLSVRADDKN